MCFTKMVKSPAPSNYEKLLLEIQELKAKVSSLEDVVFRSQLISQSMEWLWNEHDPDERSTVGFQNAMYLLIDSLHNTVKE